MNDASSPYSDIISLPHHVSDKHPHMSMLDRAAQFAPFAALTGYEAAVREAGRLTSVRTELDEYMQEQIDRKLRLLRDTIGKGAELTVTYFIADGKKDGGEYVTVCGQVHKFDSLTGMMTLDDGTRIPINDILEIEGELFTEE